LVTEAVKSAEAGRPSKTLEFAKQDRLENCI
jgi:hypothetical protein